VIRAAATATLLVLSLASCAARTPWAHATVASPDDETRVVAIDVTRLGFEPDRIAVRSGETVTLTITRRVEHTCITRVIVSLDADARLERELPLGEPVAITLRFDAPGELGLSCPMNMYGMTVEVR
jgi:plastocyanin